MVTERRRKPKRVSVVHFHDCGAVLDFKKDPQILKKRSENDTEKQTRKKGVKRDQNGARRAPRGVSREVPGSAVTRLIAGF